MNDRRFPFALLLTGLLCVPTMAFSPSDSTSGRWSLALSGGVGMGHRTLKVVSAQDHLGNIVEERNKVEKPGLAYGARLALGYRLGQRTGMELGIGALRTGWRLNVPMVSLDAPDPIIGQRADVHFGFCYLEMPVGFTWQLGQGRLRSTSAIGVAPALLISATQVVDMEFLDGRTERTKMDQKDDFERINLFAYLRTGVAYQLSDRITGVLTPAFRYGLLPIVNEHMRSNLYLWSIDLGLRMDL